ncbi:MAG: antibiotic biosynthesis monooxygenase [Burkholderiales bacterium]|nr:antibiotic biosynthesis monooxygenase [Burkholderiales bacterium]MDE2396729.1 antibiotic biosynthesis monooxygenase [Burkholderiales bacterium]
MTFRAWLSVRAQPGRRDELAAAFVARRIIEECRDTIPGFLQGELLLSEDDPDALCVTVEWADRQSFLDWQASPVRRAQAPALLPLAQSVQASQLFSSAHRVAQR